MFSVGVMVRIRVRLRVRVSVRIRFRFRVRIMVRIRVKRIHGWEVGGERRSKEANKKKERRSRKKRPGLRAFSKRIIGGEWGTKRARHRQGED